MLYPCGAGREKVPLGDTKLNSAIIPLLPSFTYKDSSILKVLSESTVLAQLSKFIQKVPCKPLDTVFS